MGKIKSIKFGNQTLIYSNRICCFNNESVEIQYEFDEKSILTIIFNFKSDNDSKKGSNFSVNSQENGKVIFNLYNFNNVLGTGTTEPIKFAKYIDKQISIVFFVYKIKDTNPILDFSLYLED